MTTIFYQLSFVSKTCPIEPASPEVGERLGFFADKVKGSLIDWISDTLSHYFAEQGENRTDQVACSDPGACASRGGHGQDSSQANSEHQRLASIQGGRHSLCCH